MLNLAVCLFQFFGYATPSQPEGNITFIKTQEMTAEDWYGRALAYRKLEKYDEAIHALQEAVALDPHFAKAFAQMGYIFLVQGDLVDADAVLERALKEEPCAAGPLEAWEMIAQKWQNEDKRMSRALHIYQELNHCIPNHPDYLFYEGRLLVRMDRRREAESVLKECLALAPQYTDAAIVLANLYIRENKLDQAESLLLQYEDSIEAKEGLARIEFRRGNYAAAEKYDEEILNHNPDNVEVRKQLASSLVSQLKYTRAKTQYEELVKDRPKQESLYRDLFEVKTHTNFSALVEGGYTNAKENDPSLKAPVVKDYYSNTTLKLFFPIFDRWRIDGKVFTLRQKENNIYGLGGTNYDAQMTGGQITSRFFFLKDWRWDVSNAGFRATGREHVAYPFINRSYFEPGSYINYRSDTQGFAAGGHYESFPIKNFSIIRSQMQRIATIDARYSYQLDFSLRPKAEVWAGRIFYFAPFNRQDGQTLFLSTGIPFAVDYLTAFYLFEHHAFENLTTSYFSFKKQWIHTLGMKLHVDILSRSYIEFIYQHGNQMTHDLYQPIGDFVYIAATQFLTSNKIIGRIGYRVKDKFKMEAEGHYFRDTLPYRDWNLQGSLQWMF